ncbi:hypothetical protein [Candidatus Ruthturnera calyptogenae]|uniref:hypothetical protein n=1 Tax=Candidatus Ruthturnera calyptogenae TaxID=386487 RepID=UPI0002E4FECB|nr:hypothetical protein [Candidatus Ruthturnera calyptogenae]
MPLVLLSENITLDIIIQSELIILPNAVFLLLANSPTDASFLSLSNTLNTAPLSIT